MTDIHERKCHDCGNVAGHIHRTGEWICCSECGSYDTRATRTAMPYESVIFHLSTFERMIDECHRDENLRERLILAVEKLMRVLDKTCLVDDKK